MNDLPKYDTNKFISNHLFKMLYKSSKNAETKWLQNEEDFVSSENIVYSEKCSMNHVNSHNLIDEEIRDLIESSGCFEKKYVLFLDENKYNVYLSYPSKNKRKKNEIEDYFEDCIMKIYLWLSIVQPYIRENCSKIMDIFIWFSSHKKKIDSNNKILGTLHVNSAFTTSCQTSTQICLYRKEEWFKVFIHETFHNLGLDFSDVDHKQNDILMTKLFNIENSNSSFRIYESYCEVWAEILNGFFVSFFQCENESACKNKFNKYMQKQIGFSVFQLVKILKYYHSNYSEFINKKTPIVKFKENTYVFSYYIVKTILLFHSVDFEKWCQDNNVNIFQFDRKNQNVLKYGRLIKTHYNKKPLLEYIQNMEKASSKFILNKDLSTTMRMTVEE